MNELDPGDLARSLSQIPLFRELQRLLFSQTGPVNWEIARQIAIAVAEAGTPGVPPNNDDQLAFAEACRIAELHLTRQSGLESPSSAASVRVLTKRQWAEVNLEGMRPFVERFSSKIQLSGELQAGMMIQGAMNALGPLLLGIQTGFLIGYLSRRVLGQYDLCLPRAGSEKVLFVFSNILELERELDFEPQQFQLWLSLHEVAHRLEFESIAWPRSHLVGLVESFIDAAQVNSDEVVERLQGVGDPDRLSHLMQNPDELLPLILTDAQRAKINEIQAFLSVLEGYAEWQMRLVGSELLPQFDRMREGMSRRRVERSATERLLEGLLGLDLKREQYRAGEKFVAEVANAEQLDMLWKGPENLPTLDEVNKPAAWLSRIVFS